MWENRLKASGEQVDDRIVEVYWETGKSRWRMMRFRDDKPNGNFKTIVDNIIQSIIDGVEKEDVSSLNPHFQVTFFARDTSLLTQLNPLHILCKQLLARKDAIRTAWKERASRQSMVHKIDFRYGPLQESPYSKVGGPDVVMGFNR